MSRYIWVSDLGKLGVPWIFVDIDSVLSDGERLQREVVRHCRILCPFARAARSERVGKLLNGEYSLASMAIAFSPGDA